MSFRRLASVLVLAAATSGAAACGRADAAAAKEQAAAQPTASATAAQLDTALARKADQGRILGPSNAMWVVMISDFQCPYCKQWHDSSMAQLRKDFIEPGKIRFAYLHLPLVSIHPHARAEAEAAMCAGVQGKFWPFAESLFNSQKVVQGMSDVSPLVNRFARELSLDMTAFAACRQSPGIKGIVENDMQQASQANVTSTPSFIIGDFLVQGAIPYPAFKKAVDSALVVAKAKAASGSTGAR